MPHRFNLFLLLIVCFLKSAKAQEKLPLTATRILVPPKIDGVSDDKCWKETVPYNQFFQESPVPGIPTNNTEVNIVYDNIAVYLFFKCYMKRDSIWMHFSERDHLFDDADAVFWGFDTYHDGQNAFAFGVSARGVQSDFKIYQNTEIDDNWDAVWDSKVTINDDGYYVEVMIPYSALRFPKAKIQDWYFDVYRIIKSTRQDFHSCNIDPDIDGIVSQWQPLTGLFDIQPPLRLSLSPYATFYFNSYNDKSGNKNDNSIQLKGGMDIKWGISESFTLDATLIPDFGQVQSDNIIYNLTAFETQYDEKRPFFTEGLELFNKAGLFYSRRVGFVSDYYSYRGDTSVTISSYPVNTNLINAAKFSGRTKKGQGIGIFNGITGNTYAEAINKEGETVSTLIDPLTNFNVLVFDQSLKNNSFVTFTNTNVIRDEGGRNANVSNLYSFLANKKYTYGGYGYLALSTLMNKDEETPEFIHGYQNKLGFKKLAGKLTFDIFHRAISPDYDQNDLGYLTLKNQNTAGASFDYNINKPFGKFNEFHSNQFLSYDYRNSNGAYMSAVITGFSEFIDKKYRGYFAYYFMQPFGTHNFYEPRTEGRYYAEPAVYEIGAGFYTDSRKSVSLAVEGGPTFWNEEGRVTHRIEVTPGLKIGNTLKIFLNSETHLLFNNVGYVDTENGSEIIFGRRDVTETENQIAGNYFFNSSMSVSAVLRYYSNKGVYDEYYLLNKDGTTTPTEYSGSGNYNFNAWTIDMGFTWWFLPGSEINLVWKNAILGFDDDVDNNFMENLSHTFDYPSNNNISLRVRYYIDYSMVKKMTGKH